MTLIRSFMIGIICLVSLVTQTNAQMVNRPEVVSKSVLREGCMPFGPYQCPARMECYVDLDYQKYGQCVCRPDFFFRKKPLKNTGLELAPLQNKDDCTVMGPISFVGAFIYLVPTAVFLYIVVVGSSMIKAIYKGGGLKLNSSCVALVFCIAGCFGGFLRNIFYAYTRTAWDKNWEAFDRCYLIADLFERFFTSWIVFECACTWFDLWQKSMTMSKKTSTLVAVVRNAFRIYTVSMALIWLISVFDLYEPLYDVPWLETTLQGMIIFTCGILSPGIARILCKNMKDVTNPNWKAASAIRTTGLNTVLIPFFFNMGFRFFVWAGIFTNQAMQMNNLTIFYLSALQMFFMFSWYQYLQFAHRRYLKDSHTSRISDYFGFTTLGLNGSRRESSIFSGKSTTASSSASGASTTSSVGGASSASSASTASMASTAEGENATDGKGTMA